MGARKYKVGPRITSIQALVQQYERNNGVYYVNGRGNRYFAPNWYGGLKLSGLSTMIRERKLYFALPLDEEEEDQSTSGDSEP